MRKYLLPETGLFYKANLHCHTVCSDGKKTPEEIKEIYLQKGYSIVAYTDHNIMVPHMELTDDNFLALTGFEIQADGEHENGFWHAKTCHICFIALEPDNDKQPIWKGKSYFFGNEEKYCHLVKYYEDEPDYVRHHNAQAINDLIKTARERGFFVTYNHPCWSKEDYSDYINYTGMHAMEIFNGSSMTLGYEDYNPRVYDDMLQAGKKIFCIGADDNHNNSKYSDSGVAFTMIKAERLEYSEITRALVSGDFYASEGPEIYDLWYEDGEIYIRCSEAERITCNYKMRFAGIVISENDVPVTEARFALPTKSGYFRITVTDKRGKRACTNAYFVEDILRRK